MFIISATRWYKKIKMSLLKIILSYFPILRVDYAQLASSYVLCGQQRLLLWLLYAGCSAGMSAAARTSWVPSSRLFHWIQQSSLSFILWWLGSQRLKVKPVRPLKAKPRSCTRSFLSCPTGQSKSSGPPRFKGKKDSTSNW